MEEEWQKQVYQGMASPVPPDTSVQSIVTELKFGFPVEESWNQPTVQVSFHRDLGLSPLQ